MIQAPRTVVLVEADEAARHRHQRTLAPQLPEFSLVVVEHGGAALDVLEARPVEVLVIDLHAPTMAGFELLAHVRERYPDMGVVVLDDTDAESVPRWAPAMGTYRRVALSIAAADLANEVRAAADERERGRMASMPDLDAALGRLSSSVGDLRTRASALAMQLAPARAEAEAAARGGEDLRFEPVRPLDAQLAELARHLADRAHLLDDELDPPSMPTWDDARRS